MSYKGRVQNGFVVFEEGVRLPEDMEVTVEPVPASDEFADLREGLRRFSGKAKNLPSDIARNHDHYLHGVPKK